MRRDETYFGSPATKLPNRQKVTVGPQWTYHPPPPRTKIILRSLSEALHTSLPTACISHSAMTADLIETPVLEPMANHDGDIPWRRAGDCCSPRRGQVAHDWRLQACDEAHVVILGHAY